VLQEKNMEFLVISLETTPAVSALPLARLEFPLRIPHATPDGALDAQLSAVRCQDVLRAVKVRPDPMPPLLAPRPRLTGAPQFRSQGLASAEACFAASMADGGAIQLLCPKVRRCRTLPSARGLSHAAPPPWLQASAARLFKLLLAEQARLGVVVKDVKSHVQLTPLTHPEMREACAEAAHCGLEAAGWWRLAGGRFLGADALAAADGKAHACALLEVQVDLQPKGPLTLRVRPSVVRFRHPAAGAAPPASGTLCTTLPDLRPALIDRVRAPTPAEAERLQVAWRAAGFALPPGALERVADVRFSDDPDDPASPFPPCCVLSQLALDPLHDRLDSPEVRAVVARLRGEERLERARVRASCRWRAPTAAPPAAPADDLATAAFGFFAPGQLRITGAVAHRATAQLAAPPARLQTARELLASGGGAAAAPGLAGGTAIDLDAFTAADYAGGSGEGASKGAPKPPKKHARAGPQLTAFLRKIQQDEAPPKPAAAPKPASVTPAAARLPSAPAPRTGPASLGNFNKGRLGAKRPAAAAAKKPPPAKRAAPAAAVGGAGSGGGAALLAAPTAPKAARAKPAEVDLAALDVAALGAAGRLGSLTVPQLKAFCKSVKLAVGGKKSDLEARVRAHLGLA
jgi:hypothetical protein